MNPLTVFIFDSYRVAARSAASTSGSRPSMFASIPALRSPSRLVFDSSTDISVRLPRMTESSWRTDSRSFVTSCPVSLCFVPSSLIFSTESSRRRTACIFSWFRRTCSSFSRVTASSILARRAAASDCLARMPRRDSSVRRSSDSAASMAESASASIASVWRTCTSMWLCDAATCTFSTEISSRRAPICESRRPAIDAELAASSCIFTDSLICASRAALACLRTLSDSILAERSPSSLADSERFLSRAAFSSAMRACADASSDSSDAFSDSRPCSCEAASIARYRSISERRRSWRSLMLRSSSSSSMRFLTSPMLARATSSLRSAWSSVSCAFRVFSSKEDMPIRSSMALRFSVGVNSEILVTVPCCTTLRLPSPARATSSRSVMCVRLSFLLLR